MGEWRKSSHSGTDACVEWRRSSGCDTSACVEVARGEVVQVRDSKDLGGPVLSFAPESWQAFVDDVKAGRLG